MSNDILDIVLAEKKKEEKYKKRKSIIKRILLVIFPILTPIIVVFFLFVFTPKQAWFSYKGKVDSITISDLNTGNRVKITSDKFQIREGKINNVDPVVVKYKDTKITLEENELMIQIEDDRFPYLSTNVVYPNIEFSNMLEIQSRGTHTFETIFLQSDSYGLFNKDISVPQINILFKKGSSFPINSDEMNNRDRANLKDFMIFDMKIKDETNISLDPDFGWQVYIKGELVKDIHDLEIFKINKDKSNLKFLAEFNSGLGTSFIKDSKKVYDFYLSGSNKTTSFNTSDGVINLIKTGEPQKFDINNTNIVTSNTSTHQIRTDITYNQNDNTIIGNIFGEVNYLTIGGFSLFPNLSQWVLNNISALITTILTAIISGFFSLYTARNLSKE
ncbi:hypothetical protein [Lysinibacillus sp. NPDC093692]|uniref:hypothetical protein n=1 Tax=Lysinibacillus sp. NPDC093692 TaxID=3390578 RepID=UPI003D047503